MPIAATAPDHESTMVARNVARFQPAGVPVSKPFAAAQA